MTSSAAYRWQGDAFAERALKLCGEVPLPEAQRRLDRALHRRGETAEDVVRRSHAARALDLLRESPEAFERALPELTRELENASHRDSDTGFLEGQVKEPGGAEGFHQSREYIARVVEVQGGEARLLLKNRFFAGEELELMTRGGIRSVKAAPFVREKTGEVLDTLGIGGEIIRMAVPGAEAGDLLRGPVRNHRV